MSHDLQPTLGLPGQPSLPDLLITLLLLPFSAAPMQPTQAAIRPRALPCPVILSEAELLELRLDFASFHLESSLVLIQAQINLRQLPESNCNLVNQQSLT